MQDDRRFITTCSILLAAFTVAAYAQTGKDESGTMAFEDLAIESAVEGALPTVSADDDLLKTLMSGTEADVPVGAIDVGKTLPTVPDGKSAVLTLDDVPASDLAVIEGAEAPAVDVAPVEEKGVDTRGSAAVAAAAEPPVNLVDVATELGLTGETEVVPPMPRAAVAAPPTDDLADLLAGEEETVTVPSVPAPPVIPVSLAEEVPVVESVTPLETVPEETATVSAVVDKVPAPPVVTDDIGIEDLIKELAGETEAEMAIERVPIETPQPPASVDVVPPPAEDVPPAPVVAPVEIVDQPPEFVDDMAIDADVLKSLTREARADTTTAAVAEAPAMELVIEGLIDEAELAVEPPTAPPPARVEKPVLPIEETVAEPVGSPSVAKPLPPVGKTVDTPTPAVAEDMGAAVENVTATGEPAIAERAVRNRSDVALDTFAVQESLKRIAEEAHGLESLQLGEQALADRQFQKAVTRFDEALRFIPERADTVESRGRARRGLAAAYYVQALSFERENELDKALAAAINAVNYGYIKAESTVRRLKLKIEKGPIAPPPTKDRRWEEESYLDIQRQIQEWLKRGREAYLAHEYEKSRGAFESVLARDPHNKEAIRMLRRASDKMYDRASMELESTRSRMMESVRDTWNPRDYGILETPMEAKVGRAATKPVDEIEREKILAKMQQIRIPEVDFRQANIRDVIDFLHSQSVENDTTTGEGRKGVNFILKLDEGAAKAGGRVTPAASTDPFAATADVFGGPAAAAPGAGADNLVTFGALDITLKEALDIVVDIAHLKYRIKESVVMIVPFDEASGEIIHRMYDVLPSFVTKSGELSEALRSSRSDRGGGDFIPMGEPGGGGGAPSAEQDWKVVFTEMGVEWPQRSSIKYVPTIGKLIVANTAENLTVFEKVLSVLNVIPYQVEIEARFVEVAQTDIDSLGLEWLLTDNWELAEKKTDAGLPLAARERLVLNANVNSGGFTKGNRFLTKSAPGGMTLADDILSMSAVLTNPEMSVILHALQQRGHTDLLSAPKITTQSGQEASLKVVTEYIYPTEFETSGIGGGTTVGAGGAAVGGGTVGAVVTPTAFETREVGVILSVLPEVTPEGQMINLTMSPEVVSEPTWKNYGSTYQSDINGDGVLETQTLNMEQPFFHTRQLNTSMLIYNGATVVMGGMITEVRHDVDDKVPFLGDIPIFGRLFRSKSETSEKRNLLIFVTARLVDPAGRPLDQTRQGLLTDVLAEGLMEKDGTK